jgi:hypothetical protein
MAWPISLMALMSFIWVMSIVKGHKLFYRFRAKYPDLARQNIPYAFDSYPHPEKFFCFFRKRSLDVLKRDRELWDLRRKVKVLTILSFVVPLTAFLFLMLIAFLNTQ